MCDVLQIRRIVRNVGNWGLQQRKVQGVREQPMESECEEIRKDFKSEVNCAKKTKRKKVYVKRNYRTYTKG